MVITLKTQLSGLWKYNKFTVLLTCKPCTIHTWPHAEQQWRAVGWRSIETPSLMWKACCNIYLQSRASLLCELFGNTLREVWADDWGRKGVDTRMLLSHVSSLPRLESGNKSRLDQKNKVLMCIYRVCQSTDGVTNRGPVMTSPWALTSWAGEWSQHDAHFSSVTSSRCECQFKKPRY